MNQTTNEIEIILVDDLLEEAYEKKEEDFINLIESYSPGKNEYHSKRQDIC